MLKRFPSSYLSFAASLPLASSRHLIIVIFTPPPQQPPLSKPSPLPTPQFASPLVVAAGRGPCRGHGSIEAEAGISCKEAFKRVPPLSLPIPKPHTPAAADVCWLISSLVFLSEKRF